MGGSQQNLGFRDFWKTGWLGARRLVRYFCAFAQCVSDRTQESVFIKWLEEASGRFSSTHDLSRRRVVVGAHQNQREVPFGRGQIPIEFNPAHFRHVDVCQQTCVISWELGGQQLFRALKDLDVEAQDLQLTSKGAADKRVVIYHDYCGPQFYRQLSVPAPRKNFGKSSASSSAST